MEYIGLKHRPTFIYNYLNPLLEQEKIKMTILEKSKSRNQNISNAVARAEHKESIFIRIIEKIKSIFAK